MARMIEGTPQIVSCERVSGEDCFVARAHVRDVIELETVIDRLIPFGGHAHRAGAVCPRPAAHGRAAGRGVRPGWTSLASVMRYGTRGSGPHRGCSFTGRRLAPTSVASAARATLPAAPSASPAKPEPA